MKKYKKYKDNPEYEFVPYSNNPQYAMGGSNSNKLHKFGQFAGNALKTSADSMLSTFGLDNVISDDMYKGGSANDFIKIGNVMGGINKTVASTAAGILGGPAAGAAVSGIQQVGSQFNPEEEEEQQDMQYAMGGMYQGQPNAEVEKQEVMQMPDGTTEQVDGYSHENGGVPVNLPQATRIFSDRLKMGKKTFAKVAQRYKTNKEEAILEDTTSSSLQKKTAQLNMSTKNKKLDEIFNMQEIMKSKRINSYIKKYGGTQMYPNGGTHNSYVSDPPTQDKWESNINSYYTLDPYNNYVDNPNKRENFVGGSPSIGNVSNPYAGDPNGAGNPMNKKGFIPPNINPATDQDVEDYNNRNKSNFYSNNKEMLGKAGTEIGLGLLNNAGNLAYLAQQGRDYDKVDYGQVTPNYLTDRESQNAIREGYSTAAYNLRNSGQQTQAGQISLGNERMKQSANSRERIGNINAQIANQGAYANQGYKIQGMQDEAGNKGVAESNYYTALNSIGQNVASQRGDYLSGQMDQKKLNLILEYFPDYELDPKTFQYMYRNSLQQSKIKKPKKP